MDSEVVVALRDVVHDLRSSLGSIRLVLTSVLDETDAAIDDVRPLLVGAEEETRRLAGAMATVLALVEAATDDVAPVSTELGPLLGGAVADVRRRDLTVSVSGDAGAAVLRSSAASVLAALFGVVAGGNDRMTVVVSGAELLLSPADGRGPRIDSAAVRHLAEALGASAEEDAGAVRLRLRPT